MVLMLVAVGVTGCRRQTVVTSPPVEGVAGAATAREAAQRFMASAKAQDLDAMSLIWGSAAGPARSTMDRRTWEQREVIMMPCLKHDSYRVQGEVPAAGGERVLSVEIRFQDLTRSTNFFVTPGPGQRWFVRAFDMDALRAICTRKA